MVESADIPNPQVHTMHGTEQPVPTFDTAAAKVLSFFPNAENTSQINWAHAVNNKQRLGLSVADPGVMMVESDILLSDTGTAIAAHPPNSTSDLSVKELVETVYASDKGLKLDFKDPNALLPTLAALKAINYDPEKRPLFLNADILQGNGNPTPFDPAQFIKTCQEYYPDAILSLGWTTNPDVNTPYSEDDVAAML